MVLFHFYAFTASQLRRAFKSIYVIRHHRQSKLQQQSILHQDTHRLKTNNTQTIVSNHNLLLTFQIIAFQSTFQTFQSESQS